MTTKRVKMEDIRLVLGDLGCTIKRFGATVVSFTKAEREGLFVSKQAVLDGSKPIRGGIPVVFPVFGADPAGQLPSHGFARTSVWRVLDQPSASKVTLCLTPAEAEWKLHPSAFRLEYEVELLLPNSLRTSLRVMNFSGLLNEDGFEFQCLLHTYLNIGKDISNVRVVGLDKAKFVDQLHPLPRTVLASGHASRIDQEVDHIYFGDAGLGEEEELVVECEGKPAFSCKRSFRLFAAKQFQCDVVVWNPWVEKARKLQDFGDDEYKEMLCIEPGNVGRRDVLRGGEDAVLTQTLSLL